MKHEGEMACNGLQSLYRQPNHHWMAIEPSRAPPSRLRVAYRRLASDIPLILRTLPTLFTEGPSRTRRIRWLHCRLGVGISPFKSFGTYGRGPSGLLRYPPLHIRHGHWNRQATRADHLRVSKAGNRSSNSAICYQESKTITAPSSRFNTPHSPTSSVPRQPHE